VEEVVGKFIQSVASHFVSLQRALLMCGGQISELTNEHYETNTKCVTSESNQAIYTTQKILLVLSVCRPGRH